MDFTLDNLASLFDEQLSSWEQVAGNYGALANVKVRSVDVGGFPFKIQFNPARIVSSAAKVDAKSIQERRCFLCAANRPAVQKGLSYSYNGEDYEILINPFPIFPKHLTIPIIRHSDQLISGRFGAMLDLAEKLAGYTLFYNGPKCGASAPDHFHFQAGNRGFLPIEERFYSLGKRVLFKGDDVALYGVNSFYNGMIAMVSSSVSQAESLFEKIYNSLPLHEGESEPMMNILCWFERGEWIAVIFAREKHRPSCYFSEGEDNILLSPASVDLGGVLITPLEKDFEKIGEREIACIMGEISVSEEEILRIEGRIVKQKGC